MLLDMGINGVTINTDDTESEIISNPNNLACKIEVQVTGELGDSDDVEIYLKTALGGGRFETGRGIQFASIELDSDNLIVKSFRSPEFETGIFIFRMRDSSAETPVITSYYRLQ